VPGEVKRLQRLQVGQLLELDIRHTCPREVQVFERSQRGQFAQPFSRKLRGVDAQRVQRLESSQSDALHLRAAADVERPQSLQFSQLLDPSIRLSPGAREIQDLQRLQTGQLFDPCIGDLRAVEVKRPERLQAGQFFQIGVCQGRGVERK